VIAKYSASLLPQFIERVVSVH